MLKNDLKIGMQYVFIHKTISDVVLKNMLNKKLFTIYRIVGISPTRILSSDGGVLLEEDWNNIWVYDNETLNYNQVVG